MANQIKCKSCEEVCYYPCEKFGGLLGLYADFSKTLKTKMQNGESTEKIENLIEKLNHVIDEFEIDFKENIKTELLSLNSISIRSGTIITWECCNSHRHQYLLDC